jgi:hypothetical protein
VRGEKGDGTVILTLVLYQCTAGACDGVRSGLSLSCNGQGGVKNPDSQGQCGSQKIMGIHKAIEEMVSMLLCHLFCQNTRSGDPVCMASVFVDSYFHAYRSRRHNRTKQRGFPTT